MNQKHIIEINGIKMEVDLRDAKVIDNYKVGDRVKVLLKKYNDQYESCIGIIIGFDAFKDLPTIVVAYLKQEYSNSAVSYLYYNAASKDCEIVMANEEDLPFTKSTMIEVLDQQINKAKNELDGAIAKKDNFVKWFGRYFEKAVPNGH